MKKALRIGYNRYYRDDIFAEHLEFIKKNIDIIDELTIFTEFSHYGYWDIETTKQTAELVKRRINQYRSIGIKNIGINILCTIGHIEEGYDVLPRANLQYMVNEKGVESKSCLCPSNDDFLAYIAERYALLADTGADYIWLDDDIRNDNHGVVRNSCFCPKCIERFNKESGNNYTAQELARNLNSDNTLKQQWNDFANSVFIRLLTTIKNAILSSNPNAQIGYMSGHTNAHYDWIVASGANKCRPGGGFYIDERPIGAFDKSFMVQGQVYSYPEYIRDIQYEYEAFNYQSLEKSIHISELESTLSIMSGCNGVLYNNFLFDDRQDVVDMIKSSAKKWEKLTELNADCKNTGVYCKEHVTARQLNEVSIPVTANLESSVAAYVLGKTIAELSDAEIKSILTKNLLTDGYGIKVLNDRGFSEYCGGNVKNIYTNGMAERFSEHEMNKEFKGYYRDIFMNFNFESNAYELEPKPEAECLSKLETINHKPLGCSMYRYIGENGQKIVADGYLMPNQMKSAAKRSQIISAVDWLTENSLPVIIEKSIKVIPTVTADKSGGMNIMLTNVSFDKTGSFECQVRSEKAFYSVAQNGDLLPLSQKVNSGVSKIVIDNIDGWNYILLTNKK